MFEGSLMGYNYQIMVAKALVDLNYGVQNADPPFRISPCAWANICFCSTQTTKPKGLKKRRLLLMPGFRMVLLQSESQHAIPEELYFVRQI
jgi:hypothetical protein